VYFVTLLVPDGKYVFPLRATFTHLEPGQNAWDSTVKAQRVQNMGFGQNGQLWMLAGQVQFSSLKPESGKRLSIQSLPPVGAYSLAYRTPDEIWISGNLLCSFDGGKTWGP